MEPATRRLRALGLHIAVHEHGDPAAPAIVLLHGYRDQARSWDAVAGALAARWRIVAPDLRGHGDSDHATGSVYTLEALVADLAILVDDLGSAPVVLVGHSLGGNVALRYAAVFPDRVARLVAIEGLGPSPDRLADELGKPYAAQLARWVSGARAAAGRAVTPLSSIEDGAARVAAAHPRLSSRQSYAQARHGLREAGGGYLWKYDPHMAPLPKRDLDLAERAAMWRSIACPVLLVNGAASWASDPAKDGRAAAFADARSVCIADAGHWVYLDAPDAFMAALEDFLGAGGAHID